MRKAMLLAAALVVLTANLAVLVKGLRNRGDAPGGTVELTDRELRLPPMSGDSTAILLSLQWEALSTDPREGRAPEWLDAVKLEELGFDCRAPATNSHAREHYSAMLPLLRYVVLEYKREADARTARDQRPRSNLVAVDAGKDPLRLRQKYADLARYVITRGLVRPRVSDRSPQEAKPPPTPRLRGWIVELVPSTVFVPQPHSRKLQGLRQRGGRTQEDAAAPPRFAVTVSWGTAYEPWVRGVRLLGASESGSKER